MLNEITLKTDLCVVGGGLAGVCTAIAAARHGIDVALMQERPVLGGNCSSEIRMWVSGAMGPNNRETGIVEEIMLENLYRNPTKNHYIWDSILLDFVKREKNITLLMNTTCMEADAEQGSFPHGRTVKINSVTGYQMTTQKRIKVEADYFADCSGDSILAPLTGAEFMFGREANTEFGEDTYVTESDKLTMGSSCLLQGLQTERDVKFTPSEFITKLTKDDTKNRRMNIYNPWENFWYLELGGTENTIDDAESTKDRLLSLALGAWDNIKNSGEHDADKWELNFLGFLPAKRESRRMKGEYIITQKDVSGDVIFPDTVAYGGWPLDDHYPGGYYHRGAANTNFSTPSPYCLPYRSLYSANVDNLFFAGRNISMTHTAMSSIRVMATCGLLGQAVGTAASIAKKNGIAPHDVYLSHISELQTLLMDDDCFLPHFKRSISPLCESTLTQGDASLYSGEDRANRIYETEKIDFSVKNGETVEYSFDGTTDIESVHVVFDSDLDRETLVGHAAEKYHATRGNVLLDSPQVYVPKTLCKSFRLFAVTDEGEREILSSDDNIKRAYHVPVNCGVTALRLQILSNWGDSDRTSLISFDFR